jgi:hemerythrin-like domain-containing protein
VNAIRTLKDSDFEGYRLAHRAMSREMDAVARMIGALAPGDRVRPRRLREWLQFLERTLHHHHVAEDRWFFPALEKKDPGFAGFRQELDAEHAVLEPLLRRTMEGLRALTQAEGQAWDTTRAQTQADAESFSRLLTEHLTNEEKVVVERSLQHLRPVDIETFNRKAWAGIPVGDLRTVLPWLLDTCEPEERARMVSKLTLGNRILYTLAWGPRFSRMRSGL